PGRALCAAASGALREERRPGARNDGAFSRAGHACPVASCRGWHRTGDDGSGLYTARPVSDGRAEALLRSALEKIVYFEAGSETLQADAATLRTEADALRADLASAAQREVQLRRRVAELEVELGRAHRDREEAARVLDAMRAERAGLMGKVLEAARIQGNETGLDFDRAGFIADLRAEAIALRAPAVELASPGSRRMDAAAAPEGSPEQVRTEAPALETVAVHSDAPRAGTSLPVASVTRVSAPRAS